MGLVSEMVWGGTGRQTGVSGWHQGVPVCPAPSATSDCGVTVQGRGRGGGRPWASGPDQPELQDSSVTPQAHPGFWPGGPILSTSC